MGHTKLNCDEGSIGVIADDDEHSHSIMHSG